MTAGLRPAAAVMAGAAGLISAVIAAMKLESFVNSTLHFLLSVLEKQTKKRTKRWQPWLTTWLTLKAMLITNQPINFFRFALNLPLSIPPRNEPSILGSSSLSTKT